MAFHFLSCPTRFPSPLCLFLHVNFDYDDLTLKYPSVTLLKKVRYISVDKSIIYLSKGKHMKTSKLVRYLQKVQKHWERCIILPQQE